MSNQTRRTFLRTGALAAAGTVSGYGPATGHKKSLAKQTLPPTAIGANERLRIGYIGIGGWARYAHLEHIVEYGAEWDAVAAERWTSLNPICPCA